MFCVLTTVNLLWPQPCIFPDFQERVPYQLQSNMCHIIPIRANLRRGLNEWNPKHEWQFQMHRQAFHKEGELEIPGLFLENS